MSRRTTQPPQDHLARYRAGFAACRRQRLVAGAAAQSRSVRASTRARVRGRDHAPGLRLQTAPPRICASGTSSSVALIVNDLSKPVLRRIRRRGRRSAGARPAASLCSAAPANRPSASARCSPRCSKHAPAGIILSPAEGSDGDAIARMIGAHTPLLVFNREIGAGRVGTCSRSTIGRGARLATETPARARASAHRVFSGGQSRVQFVPRGAATVISMPWPPPACPPEPQWLIENGADAAGSGAPGRRAVRARSGTDRGGLPTTMRSPLGLQLGLGRARDAARVRISPWSASTTSRKRQSACRR